MLFVNLFLVFVFTSAPVVEEQKSKMEEITEKAKNYLKTASDYTKQVLNTAHVLVNRYRENLMNKFKNLKNRGEAKIEEHKEDMQDFEELTEEKMKELLKQFYENVGAGGEYEDSSLEEENVGEEKKSEEKQEEEKPERAEV
ncbi:hypothetical protein NGRA_2704 [Nosema granulosis]|uniref:Uncharacterized protein n=1 Tax=Nosema granulosis TaxID=83296 RepID=A0A9P6GWJ9_9MICR|nr:hypothetical protein NGRA_2704 [Nosema granulosis]